MSYLVAILADRIKAEAVYTALEEAKLPKDQVSIVGAGYQTAEQANLLDPRQQTWRQIRLMATWLIPFGFAAGIVFDTITGLETFPWAGTLGNRLIGGVLGAGSGALGGFFMGNGPKLLIGDSLLSYQRCLEAGQYLIVVRGADELVTQAARIIGPFRPEELEGYSDPLF
ncbi:hypothetical protein IQ241_10630 [Romeria aff. gracilis LEGE 07310]|uniref:DUF1269 domain-containing protein n=1 Tax=Vasconcelosia minhoensis LEGE 07310 TaxID=915328 RepID=A0A8J7AP95_9CYAN|nr:hypothetical protein [Romeria gracilis]MBE9077746.1 hypothetical protein [Romeria aff. gracilis LEGE 07310]